MLHIASKHQGPHSNIQLEQEPKLSIDTQKQMTNLELMIR